MVSSNRKFGSSLEIEASGMLRASFADDGRMEAMDAVFDGIAVHQQMQRATGVSRHHGEPRLRLLLNKK